MIENPQFAEARAAGLTCWDIADLGGCPICWGKGKWLGITDADWKALGTRAQEMAMSCPYCRGSGIDPHHKDRPTPPPPETGGR